MNELKEKSFASCKLWKEVGKPRSGSVFNRYRCDKSAYRNGLRRKQRLEIEIYTNDFHDALLQKQGTAFWHCWKSKFEHSRPNCTVPVSGISDANAIAEKFASHFAKVCTPNTDDGAGRLKAEYNMRGSYCGPSYDSKCDFTAELVETVIAKMKRGKAAGLDGITAELLQHSHPLVACVLPKLFNGMVKLGHVPASFGQSYTISLLIL